MRRAARAERDDLPRLRARADVDVLDAVEGLEGDCRAERRRGHGQRDGAVQVVAVPREAVVRLLHHLDVEVAGRPAAEPHLALATQLDPGPRVDARGHLDREGATRTDPALRVALRARARDRHAVALAGDARPGR